MANQLPWQPRSRIPSNATMSKYMALQDGEQLHNPWIRTHIKNGAKVIKVCERSMTIRGDVKMWERLLDGEIVTSGQYFLDGALTPIQINVEDYIGEYIEPNIWIAYD